MGNANAGDAIVGVSMFVLAFLVFLGAFGVPFIDWVAEILMVVAGIMMMRGELGANARVGWLLVVLGPALFILPGFAPQLAGAISVVAVLGLTILGALKFFALW